MNEEEQVRANTEALDDIQKHVLSLGSREDFNRIVEYVEKETGALTTQKLMRVVKFLTDSNVGIFGAELEDFLDDQETLTVYKSSSLGTLNNLLAITDVRAVPGDGYIEVISISKSI